MQTAESLVDLVNAVMWAGGNVVTASRTGEGSDNAELALEILITLALRNRDRVSLIWPLIREYIAACINPDTAEYATPIVQRAVAGLFRVCQRLLPYKEDTADMLLASLKLAVNLSPGVERALSERMAADVLALIKSSGTYIRSEDDWRTITLLIRKTSMQSEALPLAFEALNISCRSASTLTAESYLPLLETCMQLIDRYKGTHPDVAARFLECADALFTWLPAQAPPLREAIEIEPHGKHVQQSPPAIPYDVLINLWISTVTILSRGLSREDFRHIRDTSIATLHRFLIASAALDLPGDLWAQTTQEMFIPLVSDLAKLAANPKSAKIRPGLEKSVRLAVNMLTKVLLQYIPIMCDDKDFFALWSAALSALATCMQIKQEAVMESVPENVKNLLLVLASSGVLIPEWRDAQGKNLWELTWTKASGISSGLNPGMLSDAGIGEGPHTPTSARTLKEQNSAGTPGSAAGNTALDTAAVGGAAAGLGSLQPTGQTTPRGEVHVAGQAGVEPLPTLTPVHAPGGDVRGAAAAVRAENGSGGGVASAEGRKEEEEESPPACKQS